MPIIGNNQEILDADSADAGVVESGLDGDDVACLELVADLAKSRVFVDIESYAVARSMEEAHLAAVALLGSAAALFKQLDDALALGEISEDVYEELQNYVRVLQTEWGKRRREVTKDRFRWGYPR